MCRPKGRQPRCTPIGTKRDCRCVAGTQMPIPETLTPRLRSLLEKMTRVDAASRPSVAQVQHELTSIQHSLVSQGMRPAFIASSHDDAYRYTQPAAARPHQELPATPQPPGTHVSLQHLGSSSAASGSVGPVQAPAPPARTQPLPAELFTSSASKSADPFTCHSDTHSQQPGCASGLHQVQENASGLSYHDLARPPQQLLHGVSPVGNTAGSGMAPGKLANLHPPFPMNWTDQPWSANSLSLHSVPEEHHGVPLQPTAGDAGASPRWDAEAAALLSLQLAGMELPSAAETDTSYAGTTFTDSVFPCRQRSSSHTERHRTEGVTLVRL